MVLHPLKKRGVIPTIRTSLRATRVQRDNKLLWCKPLSNRSLAEVTRKREIGNFMSLRSPTENENGNACRCIRFRPLPLRETVSQCTNGPYLSSRAEREILHFQLHAKKDFSPLARNDNCGTGEGSNVPFYSL